MSPPNPVRGGGGARCQEHIYCQFQSDMNLSWISLHRLMKFEFFFVPESLYSYPNFMFSSINQSTHAVHATEYERNPYILQTNTMHLYYKKQTVTAV